VSIRIGCDGWSIGRDVGDRFPSEGTHLERYSARFNAVEINSSFVWCIFDNTAAGAALENALELLEQLQFHPVR
jgi:uncharacterized protein YecE (DUF72 family)